MIRPAALLALVLVTSHADAALVTYTETFTVSGQLGRIPFNNRTMTIVGTADTATIGTYYNAALASDQTANPLASVAFVIDGFASGLLSSPVYIGFGPAASGRTNVGFFDLDRYGNGLGIPFLDVTLAGSYPDFLGTSTGPLTAPGVVSTGLISTTAGDLVLFSRGSTDITIRSQVVPEPASLAMLGLALLPIGLARRRAA